VVGRDDQQPEEWSLAFFIDLE